jgi:hypothetical protein
VFGITLAVLLIILAAPRRTSFFIDARARRLKELPQ